MCQTRVSNKSVLQECFRVLRESVLPECATRVSSKSVWQECLTRVSHKSVPQACSTRVCHKSVTKECPTRSSEKSVKQECSARMIFNAIEHLLFAFHCSVGTLLLRELLKMHSGSWLLSSDFLPSLFFLLYIFYEFGWIWNNLDEFGVFVIVEHCWSVLCNCELDVLHIASQAARPRPWERNYSPPWSAWQLSLEES